MTIKLDESATSVVVYCTECGHWRAFAWTREAAHDSACDHESRCHPGEVQAANARTAFHARRAAKSSNVGVATDALAHGNTRSARSGKAH